MIPLCENMHTTLGSTPVWLLCLRWAQAALAGSSEDRVLGVRLRWLHGAPWEPHNQKSTFPSLPTAAALPNKQLRSQFCPPMHSPQIHPLVSMPKPHNSTVTCHQKITRQKGLLKYRKFTFQFHTEPRELNLSETLPLARLYMSVSLLTALFPKCLKINQESYVFHHYGETLNIKYFLKAQIPYT